jgi:excisionase family DNA binding protein
MSSDRLLTASEVAEILAVKLSWVREATRDGRLPHVALGRDRRYRRTEILGFIDGQRRGPGAGYGLH